MSRKLRPICYGTAGLNVASGMMRLGAIPGNIVSLQGLKIRTFRITTCCFTSRLEKQIQKMFDILN
jgi:hypothetical protein